MGDCLESMDLALSEDKRRLLKAFHAFKSDPSSYNFKRISKVVKSATDSVYVENAVSDFAQSLVNRPRYSDYRTLFDSLQEQ